MGVRAHSDLGDGYLLAGKQKYEMPEKIIKKEERR